MSLAAHSTFPATEKLEIIEYWAEHVHDLKISSRSPGTREFFDELSDYRFEKLSYLAPLIDANSTRGKRMLEVGCGTGIDLLRFARNGVQVTGIDLSREAIDLARKNFHSNHLEADLQVMDGEQLRFEDGAFDLVYCHSVLQFTSSPGTMVRELHRVLRADGKAILVVHNRHSWLAVFSALSRVPLENAEAPYYYLYSPTEFLRLLAPFQKIRVSTERFPEKTRLHHGWKASLYNRVFVPISKTVPGFLLSRFGFHIVAVAGKRPGP